ncbi:pyridoxal kinase-like isoform X2 [Planococcus citri]|uniref:pyridoxal kinase-like isoform X2 n=1 Tax=Planococcus citri TaxID=170843 RepID=UPI0031F7E0A9
MNNPRVLSIQSHVVYGYVGNKCATFPLQLLGFDVDAINSVQLSNRPGYRVSQGQVLNEKDLDDLIEGIAANNLDTSYTHLLTGYVRNSSLLKAIEKVVCSLKRKNPNLIYVCDPVLGDNGRLYLPEDFVPIFRESIIPMADIIAPNQFELEILSEMKVDTLEKTLQAIDVLHNKGCKIIVISSATYSDSNTLTTVASHKDGSIEKRAMIEIPKLKATFAGTGDLFSALFLAWMSKSNDISIALENTVSTVYNVISRTIQHYNDSSHNFDPKLMELKLIQSKDDIENPKILFKSEIL